jgi:WD40 repeat protein
MHKLIFSLMIAMLANAAAFAQEPVTKSPHHHLAARKGDELPPKVLHRLGTPRMHQPGGVASIAVSRDGKWMASGDRAGTNQIYVWDLTAGRVKWILSGHIRWIARLEFSTDGEYLLASHHADTIYNFMLPWEMVCWNLKTGEVKSYYQPVDWSLSRDGKTLAVGRANPDDEDEPKGKGPRNAGLMTSLVAPTEETRIAFKGFTVDVLDFPSHKVKRSIVNATKMIQSVALSPDGAILAVGVPKEILLYDVVNRKELPAIKGLKEQVHLLRFSPDGKSIASVSDNLLPAGVAREVELWEAATGKKLGTLAHEQGWQLRLLEFTPDGNLLTQRFLGGYKLWDVKTQQVTKDLKGGVLAFFNDGKSIVHNHDPKYHWAGMLKFEDFATGKPLPNLGSRAAPLMPWKFSDDGKIAFTRSTIRVLDTKDHTQDLVQAWDVATGKELEDQRRAQKFEKEPTLMTKPNNDLGDGREIRYQWMHHTFTVVDTKTSKELFKHKVTGWPAWALSPDKKLIGVLENTMDRRVRVIDLATFKDVASIKVSVSQSISNYLFTPDSKSIATTDHQGKLSCYDVATGKLRLERGPVGSVVFAPDGRMMAVSNQVGTVDLIDLKD